MGPLTCGGFMLLEPIGCWEAPPIAPPTPVVVTGVVLDEGVMVLVVVVTCLVLSFVVSVSEGSISGFGLSSSAGGAGAASGRLT